MNFAQMLMQDVKPQQPATAAGRANTWSDPTFATKVRSKTTEALYRKVIGTEWTPTRSVELRMGTGRSCIIKQLYVYLQLGVLERRPLHGEPFNRRKGWEWRVK